MLVLFLYDFCSTLEIKTIQNENKQTMNSKLARKLPPSLAFGRFEWARFMVKKREDFSYAYWRLLVWGS